MRLLLYWGCVIWINGKLLHEPLKCTCLSSRWLGRKRSGCGATSSSQGKKRQFSVFDTLYPHSDLWHKCPPLTSITDMIPSSNISHSQITLTVTSNTYLIPSLWFMTFIKYTHCGLWQTHNTLLWPLTLKYYPQCNLCYSHNNFNMTSLTHIIFYVTWVTHRIPSMCPLALT